MKPLCVAFCLFVFFAFSAAKFSRISSRVRLPARLETAARGRGSRVHNKEWVRHHPEASAIELEIRKDLIHDFRQDRKLTRLLSSLPDAETIARFNKHREIRQKAMETQENLKESLKSLHSLSGRINKAEKKAMGQARRRMHKPIGDPSSSNIRVKDRAHRKGKGSKKAESGDAVDIASYHPETTVATKLPNANKDEDIAAEVDTKLQHQVPDIKKSHISEKDKKQKFQGPNAMVKFFNER